MDQCKICESHAINPHCYGRDPNEDLDLCDVCYWRKRAERQWQPIETAPKDETKFLFLDDNKHIDVCWWSNFDGAWVSYFSVEYANIESPTHWMPLPEPPKAEESK